MTTDQITFPDADADQVWVVEMTSGMESTFVYSRSFRGGALAAARSITEKDLEGYLRQLDVDESHTGRLLFASRDEDPIAFLRWWFGEPEPHDDLLEPGCLFGDWDGGVDFSVKSVIP